MINSVSYALETPCIEFPGGHDKDGYGRVSRLLFGGRINLAHVLSWVEANGRLPRPGHEICHRCNNPSCWNAGHLYEGTRSQNILDQVAAGRHITQTHRELFQGEQNGGSKLTAPVVRAIRRGHADGVKGRVLAAAYSVSEATISMIVHRKRWAHVPDD